MDITRSFPAVTAAQLSTYQMTHGITIPQSYQRFLLRHNGGKPSNDRLVVPNWYGHSTCISMFYGVTSNTEYDLASIVGNTRQYLPATLFPIAEDSAGNLLCLGLGAVNEGRVFFWNHEEELDDEGEVKQDQSNAYEVAIDLEHLLRRLLPAN